MDTPQVIKELHNLVYHTDHGCIDFEAFKEFLSAEETANILHCWTGDNNYHGEEFKIFGNSGDGSYYAIWLTKENTDLLNQPVVVLESEGQAYTISTNYSDFLWCLGCGFSYEDDIVTDSVLEYVNKNVTTPKRPQDEIIIEANELYDFRQYIWSKVIY